MAKSNTTTNTFSQYALITGATSGIGYELTRLFAADGYSLILVARGEDRLNEIKQELTAEFGIDVITFPKDLFQKDSAVEIYNSVKSTGITVNVLVNDAGQGEWGLFMNTELERDLEVIQLNIASLLTLTKLFGKDMVARNEGKILHLGSEAGKTPVPYLAVYAATKAFVVSFSTALANELKDTGVTVTVLLPGATDTDFFHKANMEESVTYKEKKLDSPEMVAQKGYEALMSGETRVITGQARKNVAMAAVMPDETSAKQIRKSMEPSELNENEGRQYSEHEPSRKERESIRHAAGDQSSDYPSGDANNLSRNYGNRSSDDTPRDYPGRNRDDPSPDPASGNETF